MKCRLCPKIVDRDDMFCFGCQTVICNDCDVSGIMGHDHHPEDHL